RRTAGAAAPASPCARPTTGHPATTATETIHAPAADFTVAKLPRPPARRKSLNVTTPLRIVAHERQAWHVGASGLLCHPRRAPDCVWHPPCENRNCGPFGTPVESQLRDGAPVREGRRSVLRMALHVPPVQHHAFRPLR